MTTDYTQTETPRSLVKAAATKEFPAWVGDIPSRDEIKELSDQAFGDMENRLFPIHNKSAAFYSMIDAASQPYDCSVATYERIDKACSGYGISEDTRPYMNMFVDTFDKSASADTQEEHPYAIDQKIGDDDFKLLPIGDKYMVQAAAKDLTKMAAQNRAPIPIIKLAASRIVKAASEMGADISDLDPQLRGWSVDRYTDYDRSANLIKSRMPFTREDQNAQSAYEDIIKRASVGEISASECVDKLEVMDAALEVPYNYHDAQDGVPTPHEVVHCGDTHDEIRKYAHQNVLVNDVVIPLEDVHALDADVLKFTLDKESSTKLEGFKEKDGVELSMVFKELSDEQNKEFLRSALAQCN